MSNVELASKVISCKDTTTNQSNGKEGANPVSNLDIMKELEKINNKLDESNNKMSKVQNSLESLVNRMDRVENRVDNLEKTKNEYLLETDQQISTANQVLISQINDLQKNLLRMEIHSRKSNLLFYGIPDSEQEDCCVVMRDFLTHYMGMDANIAARFKNAHRLPSRQSRGRPPPIIVSFLQMKDRDEILARAKNLAKTKMSVRTDLPPHLKKERGRLAEIAYNLRKEGKRTSIKLKDTTIELYVNGAKFEA